MKKITAIILAVLMIAGLAACGSSDGGNSQGGGQGGKTPSWTVSIGYEDGETQLSCERLPESVDELKEGIDLSDRYQTAYGTILAFCVYENDPDLGLAMLDWLNGPEDVSAYDISFIKDQFSQYPYVARSYFTDTTPDNDYETETYEASFFENDYSFTGSDTFTLWTRSSGADSERSIGLKLKASEDSWYANNWYGILAGIRPPASEDKWN